MLKHLNWKEKKRMENNWFSFETRIKKLIQDLVDPIQKRAPDAKEASDAQRKGNDSLKQKVEEFEFAVHKIYSSRNRISKSKYDNCTLNLMLNAWDLDSAT